MSKQNNTTRKLALDSPDRKPSVFERLGTKSSASSGKNVCHSWAQNGTCSLNKTCKYAHTHVLISPSKRSKSEAMKKQSLVVQKRTGKEEHKKTRSHQCGETEWEGWELGDLEDADEKALERRKQELQRELQLQLKKEKQLTRKKDKRSDKKRASSTSSSSTTTTESSTSSTSSSSSSSEPRKRQGRKRKHGSTSSDSDVSSHRPRKSPKTVKVKVSNSKKNVDKKEGKNSSDPRSKSVIVTKKSVVQKKSASPVWEKSRAKTPHSKQQAKKSSPHQSPADSKNRSPSPRYDRALTKSKARTSPKLKAKESSPKRTTKKVKDSNLHTKDKVRQSPTKSRSSPSRVHKVSPSRSRRHEDSEKRRGHYDDRKHSPRRERSREKDRKRDVRRGHSNENDNGGLKKGGKILPLKPSSYAKDNTVKPKESGRRKSVEKSSDVKSKDVDCEKDKIKTEKDKERNDKDKGKTERDKVKHKKSSETHDRHSVRDRESDRNSVRNRDERGRDREAERLKLAKEREAERQKERDEALERCRERQRERERLEKERKEKEDKKHQRDATAEVKQKEGDKELPSLLDLKTENPRSHSDSCNNTKNSDKHAQRETRRNAEKGSEKTLNTERDRDRERLSQRSQGSPADKDHDRREPRRTDDNERRQSDKDFDTRRTRESEARHVSEIRRPGPMVRRPLDESDCRRVWDDIRRAIDGPHDRRRLLDPGLDDRRPHPMLRRPVDDQYDYRRARDDPDLDVRDFPPDDRRARKLLHSFHHDGQDWDAKAQDLEYREAELRDEWNHPDRHHDWAVRYEHKWLDREEARENLWNHYSRRAPHDDWSSDWVPEDQSRPLYGREPNEDQLEIITDGFPDHNGRRHDSEAPQHGEPVKEQPHPAQGESSTRWDKNTRPEGDALSDISDDPDDILNQEDEATDPVTPTSTTAVPITAAAASTITSANDSHANQSNTTTGNDSNANQNNANSTSSVQNQQIYVRNNDFFFDQRKVRRPLLECFGERALDFEEISDEELEEEARAGKGIMDVLGADWAGLIKDVRPRPKRPEGPVVAHRCWMIDTLISRIGISVKYAGPEFTKDIINKCKKVKQENECQEISCQENSESEPLPPADQVKEAKEKVEMNHETYGQEFKREPREQNISMNITVKIEQHDTKSSQAEKPEVGINLYHEVPALHNSLRECKNYRLSLFTAHNRFKRALSARTDLSLRRELCNLPSKEPLHFTPPLDNKMYENSIKLFQRAS